MESCQIADTNPVIPNLALPVPDDTIICAHASSNSLFVILQTEREIIRTNKEKKTHDNYGHGVLWIEFQIKVRPCCILLCKYRTYSSVSKAVTALKLFWNSTLPMTLVSVLPECDCCAVIGIVSPHSSRSLDCDWWKKCVMSRST